MGIEQSNYSTTHAKPRCCKIKLFPLLITTFVILLLAIPYYIKDIQSIDDENTSTALLLNNPVQNLTCPHYKIALFISSYVENYEKRMLMREELFGITDNLIPCMKQDTTEIFYKFFVKKKTKVDRKFRSEQMEYNDIIEIGIQHDDEWHQSLLQQVSMRPFFVEINHMTISLFLNSLLNIFFFPLLIFRLNH
jgi:hypothetical protein